MLTKPIRIAALILLITVLANLSWAQTEEEDMNFAVGHMGLQLSRLLEGDTKDRSETFPKNPYGDIVKGMYQFVRAERIRVAQLEDRADFFDIEKVSGLEWTSSPKAALRLISKVSSVYGAAKVAQVKEIRKAMKLGEDTPSDSPMLASFKAGFRTSFNQKFEKTGSDSFTPFLIFLSRLEEVYHQIDQNKADLVAVAGPLAVFKSDRNNLIFEQKLSSMLEAARKLEAQFADHVRNLDDAMDRLKGFRKATGSG